MKRSPFKSKGRYPSCLRKRSASGCATSRRGAAHSGEGLRLSDRGLGRCTLVHRGSMKTGSPGCRCLEKSSLELKEGASHIDWILACPKFHMTFNHCYISTLYTGPRSALPLDRTVGSFVAFGFRTSEGTTQSRESVSPNISNFLVPSDLGSAVSPRPIHGPNQEFSCAFLSPF